MLAHVVGRRGMERRAGGTRHGDRRTVAADRGCTESGEGLSSAWRNHPAAELRFLPEVPVTTAAVRPPDRGALWTLPGVYTPQADTRLLARALRAEGIAPDMDVDPDRGQRHQEVTEPSSRSNCRTITTAWMGMRSSDRRRDPGTTAGAVRERR